MSSLDAASQLLREAVRDFAPSRLVVWGEDIRELAGELAQEHPGAHVSGWNDAAGPKVAGVEDVAEGTPDPSVELVVMRLPKSRAQLDDWARKTARLFPAARLVAAGMDKHMTITMNDVLRSHYARLDIAHAQRKARALIARDARLSDDTSFSTVLLDESAGAAAGLKISGLPGVFASGRLDLGTRVLLDTLDERLPVNGNGELAVDLGSGSGVVAVWLARRGYRVHASDRSRTAVTATQLTVHVNGFDDIVTTSWEDALASLPARSAGLVVLNPPFHEGARVTRDPALRLFDAAKNALRSGGELVTVWNSHLRYRPELERRLGPTTQWARNPKFTVTVSHRR